MNYKDLQNISYLSQQILTEAASEEYDVMNRWPYASPYLQEERAPGVKPYRPNPTQAEVRANAAAAAKKKAEAGKDKPGWGRPEKFNDWKNRVTPSSTLRRRSPEGGTEPETVSQRMNREKPYGKRMTGQMAREYGSRHAAEVTRVVKGAGEPQAVTYPRKKGKPSTEIIRRGEQKENFELWVNSLLDEGYDLSNYTWDDMYDFYLNEAKSYDLYDLILAHLIDEGYAETPEAATAIMANMSEDWRESICEGPYDVYLNRMGLKSKLSDIAKDIYKSPEQQRREAKERKKRNRTHSMESDLLNNYIDIMNKKDN